MELRRALADKRAAAAVASSIVIVLGLMGWIFRSWLGEHGATGSEITVLCSVFAIFVILCAVLAYTHMVRNAAFLLRMEARYRALFDSASDAIFLHGVLPDGSPDTFADVNSVACRRLGYTREELLRLIPADIDGTELGANCPALVERMLRDGEALFETVHVARDGRRIPVEIIARVFTLDGERMILSHARDITARVEMEKELARRTKELGQLVDAARRLSRTLDIGAIGESVHECLAARMDCANLFVSSFDPATNLITCEVMWHEGVRVDVAGLPPIPLEPEGMGVQSVAIRGGKPSRVDDLQSRLKQTCTAYHIDSDGIVDKPEDDGRPISRSAIVVPLIASDRVVGAIQVQSYRLAAYTDEDLAFLVAFSSLVATAMANAGLLRQSQREIDARRRAEEALRAANATLDAIIRSAPVAVVAATPDGAIHTWNPAAETIFGWSEADVKGRRVPEDFPDISPCEEFERLRNHVAAGSPIEGIPLRHTGRNGQPVDLTLSAAPIRGADGETVGLVAIMEDISLRKTIEEASRRSERELRLWNRVAETFLTLPDEQVFAAIMEIVREETGSEIGAFAFVDKDGRLVYPEMSPDIWAQCRIPGPTLVFPREEWRGSWGRALLERRTVRESGDFHPPEGHIAISSFLAAPIIHQGETIGLIKVANRPGGYDGNHEALLEAVAGRVAPLLRARIEREQREAERRKAEDERRLLYQAIDQSDDIIVVADATGRMQYANEGAERVIGYAISDVIGSNVITYIVSPPAETVIGEIMPHVRTGNTWHGALSLRAKDGGVLECLGTASPVHDAAGVVVSVVVVIRDMTREFALERQLRQAQKMEAIGRLAGGVAHDFNNLLTVISGYGELLQSGIRPEDPAHAQVAEIVKAARKAAEVTQHLLAFSRKAIIMPRVMNLAATLRNIERMLCRIIGEDIKLLLEIDDHTWNVRTDPGQLEQIIMNLVTNARDAMPDGGELTIELGNAVLDDEYARLHSEVNAGQYVLLMVSDTGIGMDEETQAQVFEPFFSTKGEMGTGLGLSTVFGIVMQHNGHISVYSEKGMGTTFKVYLPAVDVTVGEELDEPMALPSGCGTVLIVEDDRSILDLALNVLASHGYTVLPASDGNEAIRIAASHSGPIALLMTDVVLPGMNGRQVADRIIATRPEIRVLFTSGYAEDVIAHHGVLDEGIAFIQKPYRVVELLAMVRRVLEGEV